jgi:hypothetical protein
MISSDLPELLALSDTIFAMRGGRITARLDPRTTDQEEVLRYMALDSDPDTNTDPATGQIATGAANG